MSFLLDASLWNWGSPVWLVLLPVAVSAWVWRTQLADWKLPWLIASLSVLILAFVSPIGVLADGYLFSAHMVQHLLLLLVVPLFFVLSLPRPQVEQVVNHSKLAGLRSYVAHPMLGWVAGLGMMWLWHVPSLCSAATQSSPLGWLRTITFLGAGLAFWWPIYTPVRRFRLEPLLGVIYLFSACVGCTLLGIYITFTTISVCPAFANPVDRVGILTALYQAGFTPMVDQQLGGLLMWVPPCSLYVCAIIGVMCRWYAMEEGQYDSASNATLPTERPEASV